MSNISVIIPTYNRAPFIIECLNSVLNQTYHDFELIVVDDGSTDGTEELLKPYEDRLKYIWQKNQGPSAARNTGIQQSKGEWLTFLDSDDLWLPKKFEKQVEFIQNHPDSRICYTEEIWYRKGVRVNPKQKHQKFSGWIYKNCLPLCIISPSSVMIHRSIFDVVGLFDETLPACEDYDLWLRISAQYPVYLIEDKLIIKRNGHEEQQSQKYWGMDRFRIQALQKMLNLNILSQKNYESTLKIMKEKIKIVALGCEKRGKMEEAKYFRCLINDDSWNSQAINTNF